MIAAIAATNPRDLSSQQRRALALLASGARLYRLQGGWGRAPSRVSLDVAMSLQARGLVRVDRSGINPQLVLTGAGQTIQAVIEVRRERRRA